MKPLDKISKLIERLYGAVDFSCLDVGMTVESAAAPDQGLPLLVAEAFHLHQFSLPGSGNQFAFRLQPDPDSLFGAKVVLLEHKPITPSLMVLIDIIEQGVRLNEGKPTYALDPLLGRLGELFSTGNAPLLKPEELTEMQEWISRLPSLPPSELLPVDVDAAIQKALEPPPNKKPLETRPTANPNPVAPDGQNPAL